MHDINLILTLTAGLTAALAFGFLALRLKMTPIAGYLLAGLLLGPYTPGFVADRGIADQLAEIGVVLLMFGVGLHFHWKDLVAVRRVAVTGALIQISVSASLVALVAHSFGWSWPAGIVFGVALSVASTVVLTRVLADNGDLHSNAGRIAIGWLVMQDLFTVFVLVALPAIFGGGEESASGLAAAVAIATLKLGALTALTLGPGRKVLPYLLSRAARSHSRELFTLAVLVIALGIAVGSAKLFGVSMALGAFLAGMVVGQSEFSYRAASEALPMRDAFAVLFFVSSGMLFNPQHLMEAPLQILATVLAVVIGTPLTAFLIVVSLGYGTRIGLRVAVALAQIGEFSFIVAMLGDQLKILPPGATGSLVAASIFSITLNPLLYRLTPVTEKWLLRNARLRRLLEPREVESDEVLVPSDGQTPRAVIAGYGPVGQTVAKMLRERGIDPVIIELNVETVRRLNRQGMHAVYGDATQPEILQKAGVADAVGLILSPPAEPDWADLIRVAKKMNPRIRVLVRCAFLSQMEDMRHAGADVVFSAEAEVSMAMAESILQELGATPEQMNHEREKVRRELYNISGEAVIP